MSENNKVDCKSGSSTNEGEMDFYVISVNGVPQLWTWNKDIAISRAKSWLRASLDVSRQGCGDYLIKVPVVRVTRVAKANSV
jgi:hypothetical protein